MIYLQQLLTDSNSYKVITRAPSLQSHVLISPAIFTLDLITPRYYFTVVLLIL